MSYKKFFWGIVLIFIGLLFVLKNLGIIFFTWGTIFHLWPLLLVFWGISLLPIKGIIKLLATMVIILFTLFFVKDYNYHSFFDWDDEIEWFDDHDDEDGWDNEDENQTSYEEATKYHNDTEEMNIDYKNVDCASLTFDVGAGNFNILPNTLNDDLVVFKKKGNQYKYALTSKLDDDCQEVYFKMKKRKKIKINRNIKNQVDISLHNKPVWDLEFNVGASDLSLDLSPYNVKYLDIDSGVSNMDLKLGSRADKLEVEIDAGVSDFNIHLPSSVGAKITFDAVFFSKKLSGFIKKGDTYYSKNYDEADKKIIINIDAGISDVSIDFYE